MPLAIGSNKAGLIAVLSKNTNGIQNLLIESTKLLPIIRRNKLKGKLLYGVRSLDELI